MLLLKYEPISISRKKIIQIGNDFQIPGADSVVVDVVVVVAAAVVAKAGVVGFGRSVTKVNAEGLAVVAVVSLGGAEVVEGKNDADVLKK